MNSCCAPALGLVAPYFRSSSIGARIAPGRKENYEGIMAKGGNRVQVKLRSSESPHRYYTVKNKRNTPHRLELKKYDPVVRKHVLYKEEK